MATQVIPWEYQTILRKYARFPKTEPVAEGVVGEKIIPFDKLASLFVYNDKLIQLRLMNNQYPEFPIGVLRERSKFWTLEDWDNVAMVTNFGYLRDLDPTDMPNLPSQFINWWRTVFMIDFPTRVGLPSPVSEWWEIEQVELLKLKKEGVLEINIKECVPQILGLRDKVHQFFTEIQLGRFEHPDHPGHIVLPKNKMDLLYKSTQQAKSWAEECNPTRADEIEGYLKSIGIIASPPNITSAKGISGYLVSEDLSKQFSFKMDELAQVVHLTAMDLIEKTGKVAGCDLMIPVEEKVEGWVGQFCAGVTTNIGEQGKAEIIDADRVQIQLNNHKNTISLVDVGDPETGEIIGYKIKVFNWLEGIPGHHWYRGKMIGDVVRDELGLKCRTFNHFTKCEGIIPLQKMDKLKALAAFMCSVGNTDLMSHDCQDVIGHRLWEDAVRAAEDPALYEKGRLLSYGAQQDICNQMGLSIDDEKDPDGSDWGDPEVTIETS